MTYLQQTGHDRTSTKKHVNIQVQIHNNNEIKQRLPMSIDPRGQRRNHEANNGMLNGLQMHSLTSTAPA